MPAPGSRLSGSRLSAQGLPASLAGSTRARSVLAAHRLSPAGVGGLQRPAGSFSGTYGSPAAAAASVPSSGGWMGDLGSVAAPSLLTVTRHGSGPDYALQPTPTPELRAHLRASGPAPAGQLSPAHGSPQHRPVASGSIYEAYDSASDVNAIFDRVDAVAALRENGRLN
jgi:hypothetical protein